MRETMTKLISRISAAAIALAFGVATQGATASTANVADAGVAGAAASLAPAAAPVSMRWEILRNELSAQGGRTKARLKVLAVIPSPDTDTFLERIH